MLEIHLMNDREVVVRKTVEAGTMHLYGSGIDPKEQDRLNRASSIPRREWVMGHGSCGFSFSSPFESQYTKQPQAYL